MANSEYHNNEANSEIIDIEQIATKAINQEHRIEEALKRGKPSKSAPSRYHKSVSSSMYQFLIRFSTKLGDKCVILGPLVILTLFLGMAIYAFKFVVLSGN